MWQFVPGRNSNARGHPFACCERPLFHGFHKCQGRWSHGGGLDLCATGDRLVNSGRLKLRSGGKAASVVTQEGYALTELTRLIQRLRNDNARSASGMVVRRAFFIAN